MARPQPRQPDPGWRLIGGVVAIVVGALLSLSMWSGGAAGQVGAAVYQAVLWACGRPGLLVPILVIGLGTLQFHPRAEQIWPRVTFGALGTFIGIAGLWHIWAGMPGRQLGAEAMRHSGGVIGATASVHLSELFSTPGAVFLLLLFTALALMALTNTHLGQIYAVLLRLNERVNHLWAISQEKRAIRKAAKAERDARFAQEEAAQVALGVFDGEEAQTVEETPVRTRRRPSAHAPVSNDECGSDPTGDISESPQDRYEDHYEDHGEEFAAFITDFGDEPDRPGGEPTLILARGQEPTLIERSYRPGGRTHAGEPSRRKGPKTPRPGARPVPPTGERGSSQGHHPRPPQSPDEAMSVGDPFADDDETLLAQINQTGGEDHRIDDEGEDREDLLLLAGEGYAQGEAGAGEDGHFAAFDDKYADEVDDLERAELEADGDDRAVKLVPRDRQDYVLPPVSMLETGHAAPDNHESLLRMQQALAQMLEQFGVDAQIVAIRRGPTVTRFELELGVGVKVAAITKLDRDIAYALATPDVRIVAPIPGKVAIGIEVPNEERDFITLGDILMSDVAEQVTHPLAVALGLDIGGRPVMINLAKMPHLLIAGATGSGKSVVMNGIVTSLVMRNTPDQVRMILIDPKQVEMAIYEDVPHLLTRVVTDPKRAKDALDWLVDEMERRYGLLRDYKVRHLDTYNEKVGTEEALPYIVCIIDELADLMMVAKNDVETAIVRIAQKARAVGIHLVIATQRPSVNVVTGLIKANVPSRIALSMATGHDSKTILDQYGAEKLIGQGDMLYMPANVSKPHRLQGSYVDETEIEEIVAFCKAQAPVVYESNIIKEGSDAILADIRGEDATDEDLTRAAMDLVVRSGLGSTSMLQRKLQIGFARAGRIMDELERMGVVGPSEGPKARVVLMTVDELEDFL